MVVYLDEGPGEGRTRTGHRMATIEDVGASIDALQGRGLKKRSEAFAAWFATMFDIDEDDAVEAASLDGGNDNGIDIVFADVASEQIYFVQAYHPQDLGKVTPLPKWNALLAARPYIEDPERLVRIGRKDLADMIIRVKEENPDFAHVLCLASLGTASEQIRDSVNAHNNAQDSRYRYEFMHQGEIVKRYSDMIAAENGIVSDKLKFTGNYFVDEGGYGKAWVGSISAQELIRLHEVYGDDLFGGNVRLFLGQRRGGINYEMIETAKKQPENFWALNNGITFLADSVVPLDGDLDADLQLRGFSIVNGCQTTSCLVAAGMNDARVLARVVEAKGNIRNDVVLYNNSQNAVKIWTVRAADKTQRRLRDDFQKIGVSYAPKAGKKKARKGSVIELDKVAQYLAAAHQTLLIQAINNKGDLFDQPYATLFDKGVEAKHVYLAWLVGTQAENERVSQLEAVAEDKNVDLLSVKSTFWIVYCVYKILTKFVDIKAPAIALERMTSSEFQGALRKYVAKAASIYFDTAVDTYDDQEYSSHFAVFRSTKFLDKLTSKVNRKVGAMNMGELPNLVEAARSAKGKQHA